MLTNDEYDQLVAWRSEGVSAKEMAARLGHHPATIAKWLKAGRPPQRQARPGADPVLNAQWAAKVARILAGNAAISAAKVHHFLAADGFPGSYPTVVRHLRSLRGPRRATPRRQP